MVTHTSTCPSVATVPGTGGASASDPQPAAAVSSPCPGEGPELPRARSGRGTAEGPAAPRDEYTSVLLETGQPNGLSSSFRNTQWSSRMWEGRGQTDRDSGRAQKSPYTFYGPSREPLNLVPSLPCAQPLPSSASWWPSLPGGSVPGPLKSSQLLPPLRVSLCPARRTPHTRAHTGQLGGVQGKHLAPLTHEAATLGPRKELP